ncbi:MAG: TolB-like 6-bladed beta-propeller domain-containing protein, partial [Muribaculaceae bacterium]|nr:TolB-like 6-bladed beta-propeller domain-containing protein [Muribaculaceae bacterium]
ISAIGRIGEGPDDFINPRILNSLTTGDAFFIGDAKKVVRYSADSICLAYYAGGIRQSLPPEVMLYNYLLIDSDSLFVYSQTGEHPVSVYDPHDQRLSFIDYFPDIEWNEGSEYIRNMEVFANCMTSNGENIAIAYHNWNTISIITPAGDCRAELFFPDWDYNLEKMHIDHSTGNLKFSKDAKIYFTKIRSNKRYIFALGWSATKEQIRMDDAVSFIYVLGWDGNVVKKVVFDKGVANFCISGDSIPYVTAIGDDGEIHVFGCKLDGVL